MRISPSRPATLLTAAFALSMLGSATCSAEVIYNNLTPNNSMAATSRPGSGGVFEIESADDFVLTTSTSITGASFIGLLVPGIGGIPSISEIVIEIYRVFPNDSNVGRTSGPPTFSTPEVPTRVNSPSDVATDSRDSATAGDLTFLTALLNPSFTTVNSVQPGGIHPSPLQTTGGNGPLTGQEIQFNVTFTNPFLLPADHYFFIPQIAATNGGEFYWLSASRPISGAGTTPFPAGFTDLQSWTRDASRSGLAAHRNGHRGRKSGADVQCRLRAHWRGRRSRSGTGIADARRGGTPGRVVVPAPPQQVRPYQRLRWSFGAPAAGNMHRRPKAFRRSACRAPPSTLDNRVAAAATAGRSALAG
jgi:hypothetical protein